MLAVEMYFRLLADIENLKEHGLYYECLEQHREIAINNVWQ